MLSPRWRKVLRDFLGNKSRTALVVLSTAVGIFAVGMIFGSFSTMSADLSRGYLAANPAGATLTTMPFDDDMVQTVRGMKEVGEAEGRRIINLRVKVGPDEWRNLALTAVNDFNNIRINKLDHEAGVWSPPDHQLLLECSSQDFLKSAIGDEIVVKTSDGKEREMKVAGRVRDIGQVPTFFSGSLYGYITLDTLEWLGGERNYNQILITASNDTLNKNHVQQVAEAVRNKVEKSGRNVYFTFVAEPGKHILDSAIQAMQLMLGVLGAMALLLSGFLVVNIISAILAQQVRQIGIMKAVGARNDQVMGLYFGTVLIFGLMSLVVAIPLGNIGANGMSNFMAGFLNFPTAQHSTPTEVLLMEITVGLLVPLLAALYPILSGTRVTVREALSSYGMGKGRFGGSIIDKILEKVTFLSRPLLLSLRNTFRRKGRLALTLMTLTLGGTIFMGILSVRASTVLTINDALDYWKYDIELDMERPYRVSLLEQEALKVPGVVRVETWGLQMPRRIRADKTESDSIGMIAPLAQTELLNPVVIEGRWLLPGDENAIVINTDLLKKEKDLKVGDFVTLKMQGREAAWQIVGIVRGVLSGPIVYANYPYFAEQTREVGQASIALVVTEQHDAASQTAMAKALEEQFKQTGLRISTNQTTENIRSQAQAQFDLIVVCLMIMAVLLAVVGGLGLMGTMSLNVLERSREIGVMRAIGASDGAVVRIFLVEGILIGTLSWFFGTLFAFPMSKSFSDAIGVAFVNAPLSYSFSFEGVLLWLAIVLILSALSSILPAWNASRLSVKEVLAYE